MWSESSLIVSTGLGKHDLPFANTVSKDVCTSAEARRKLVFIYLAASTVTQNDQLPRHLNHEPRPLLQDIPDDQAL